MCVEWIKYYNFKNSNTKVTSINVAKEDNLYKYINLAKWKHILNNNDTDIAHHIRISSNEILHIKDKKSEQTEKVAYEIIFKTVKLIESIYR